MYSIMYLHHEMMITVNLVSFHNIIYTQVSLEMRTLRIYSQHLSYIIYCILAIFIMLYLISLIFVYLISESLYLLTTISSFSFPLHSPLPTSSNHKSDFFFSEFVCFWSIINLQHCNWPGTQHSDLIFLYISKWSP